MCSTLLCARFNQSKHPLGAVLTGMFPCLLLFFFLFFFSSFLWLYTSWPDHTRRAVLLPQSHQCSRKAEMAGGAGNSQSLPYRQPNQERKRYLDTLQDTVASKNRVKAFRPGIVQTILTYKCCKAFARLLKLWSAVCVHNEYRASGEYRGAEN